VAGLKRLVAERFIKPDEDVVAVLTGHVLKDTDYAFNYHRETLFTHDRSPDKSKDERRLAGSYSNPPARVKATKAAILEHLRRREQEPERHLNRRED
jgi:threonine synthase